MPPPAVPNKEVPAAPPSEGKNRPNSDTALLPTMKRARDTPTSAIQTDTCETAGGNADANERDSARSDETECCVTAKRMRVPPQIIVYDFSTVSESHHVTPVRSPTHAPASVLSGNAHTSDAPNRRTPSEDYDSTRDPTSDSTRGRGAFLDAVGVSDSTTASFRFAIPCVTKLDTTTVSPV